MFKDIFYDFYNRLLKIDFKKSRKKLLYILVTIVTLFVIYLSSDKTSISRCVKGIFSQQDIDQCRLLGKSFWDWLKLGVTPILVFYLSRWFQEKDRQKNEKDEKLEKQKIEIHQKEQAFQDYIDRISKLLKDVT